MSLKTQQFYANNLRIVRNIMTNNGTKEMPSYDNFPTPVELLDIIKDYKDYAKRTLTNFFISLIVDMRKENAPEMLIYEYSKFHKSMSNALQKLDEENTDKIKHGKTIKDIIKNIDHSRDSSFQNLLIGLYTLIPPRRLMDYTNMRLSDGDMTDDYNWYNPTTHTFTFNVYKTYKFYGQYVKKLNSKDKHEKKLIRILDLYIDKSDIVGGDFLLGSEMTESAMSKAVARAIKTVIGERIGATELRHMYVTEFHNRHKNAKVSELQKISIAMGHSIVQNLKYKTVGDTSSSSYDSMSSENL